MFKTLITKNSVLFDDKLKKSVLNLCKHLSNFSSNHWINDFESFISCEKLKAKNYFLIEDKCNVLNKLNAENMSVLLETKVNNVFKWTFDDKSCALIELNDKSYLLRREIRRSMGLENNINKKKFSVNNCRYLSITSCPKILSKNSSNVKNNTNFIQRMDSRKKDNMYLSLDYLKTFKSNEELLKFLLSDKNVSELDHKIRFFLISQLERYICQSSFKDYQILPFGSSIAGLGTPTSDLDLVLMPQKLLKDSDSKWQERERLKHNLSIIADLLETSIPFYSHFSRILRARIPIINFGFDLAPVDIDLSIELSPYSVHHGVYMSAFLNYCTQMNPNIRDLILLLRIWGKQHRILKPKNWGTHTVYTGFTSFQLTSLVIFFLQSQGLVPPMKKFLNNESFQPSKRGLDSIEMLSDFFLFVSNLRYEWEAISILNGNTFTNPDNSSPIYMENPLNIELNMCRNVSPGRFRKFLEVSNICSDIMQTQGFSLAEIFDSDLLLSNKPLLSQNKGKPLQVNDLFDQ